MTRRIRELPDAPTGVRLPAGIHRYATPALFGAYASGGRYVLAPHVRYLSRVITEALARGDARIIVELPPRFGKSTMISGFVPPWFLGLNPDKRVGLITYEADYSHTWGRRGRDLLDAHGHIFPGGPIRPSPASRAAGRWDIDGHAGGLVATGIGGAITGRGFDLLIIDDYVKNQAEALSSTYREKTWDYWQATLSTRIEPGGTCIILACMVADTRVLMADGSRRRIVDVSAGDEVRAFDAKDGAVARKVIGMRSSGWHETLEVATPHGRVRCNERHPFLVVEREATTDHGDAPPAPERVLRARSGTWNGQVTNTSSWGYRWVRAGDLKPGDIVVEAKAVTRAHRGSGFRPRVRSAKRQVDNGFMWLLGMLVGDGWVTTSTSANSPAQKYAVCVALGVNEEANEQVAAEIERWWGRRPYRTDGRYFRLDSTPAGKDLERLGFAPGQRAGTKRVPEWVFRARPDLQRSFLRGYIEADGWRARGTDAWSVVSVSRDLIDDVRLLAMNCGVRASGPYERTATVQPPNSPAPVEMTSWSLGLGFRLAKREGFVARGFPHEREFRFGTVKEVRRTGLVEEVFDLAVEGESFIADAFVVHNTRWHEDDLIGRLRAQSERAARDGDTDVEQWTVVTMRAIAEEGDEDPLGRHPGEPLWPGRWTADRLARVRRRVGEFWWASLFQQRPAPAEGGHFKRSWVRRYTRRGDLIVLDDRPVLRSGMVVFQTVDVAASMKASADYTVVATWGWVPTTGDLILLDVWRDRIELPRQPDLIREQAAKWSPAQIGVESNTYGLGLIQGLRTSGLPIVKLHADADKLARALPAAAMYAARQVWHPHPHEALWVSAYEDEIASFPNGKNDDQVDAAGYAALACQRIGRYSPGGRVSDDGGDDLDTGYGDLDPDRY